MKAKNGVQVKLNLNLTLRLYQYNLRINGYQGIVWQNKNITSLPLKGPVPSPCNFMQSLLFSFSYGNQEGEGHDTYERPYM